jgi:aryl-alcohol dehydrogenase-like predicted oxidoreductase
MLDRAERVLQVIDDTPYTPVDVAFSWLLSNPLVASVIAGASNTEQVQVNAATANVTIDPALLAALDVASGPDGA